MIRVAVSNSPVDVAWAEFDQAAIAFRDQYERAADMDREDTPEDRAARMKAGQDVARLWDAWRALYLADQQGGAA